MSDMISAKNNGEDVELGLADIAGIDMADIQEFEGFEATPKGLFDFNVTDAGLDTVETANGTKGIIFFELEIDKVHTLVADDIDPTSVVGRKHRETIFIGDVAKSVGQAKAIMTNAGFTGSGNLEALLDAFCGHGFTAPVTQRKDKNDTDKVYANLAIKKITPKAP